jgi:hypothetical protein
MKAIVLLLFVLASNLSYGQLGKIANVAGEAAETAMVVRIGLDVVDQTFQCGDKLRLVLDEHKKTRDMLKNKNTWVYTSSHLRNKTLREMDLQAAQVEIYAITLKNFILIVQKIANKTRSTSAAQIKAEVEAIAAKAASAAGGTEIFGMKFGGSEDADVINEIKQSRLQGTMDNLQQSMLMVLLEVDKYNRLIDGLYYSAMQTRYQMESSFGVGVMIQHSAYTAQSLTSVSSYNKEQERLFFLKLENNKRQYEQSLAQRNAELRKTNMQLEQQLKTR